jgi:hypothetical protein
MRILLSVFALLALLSGCASVPAPVAMQARDGQDLSYSQGMGCAQGHADTADGFILTSVCAQSKGSGRAALIVRVSNRTARPITIEETAVTAQSALGAVRVLAHTALMKEEKTRQAWAAFGAGLAAAGNSMNAANAGYTTHQGSAYTTASAYGAGGSVHANARTTYSGTSYNSAAAANAQRQANADNARLFDQLQAQKQMGEQAIEGALRTHTVRPGEAHAAYVEIELPRRSAGEMQPIDVALRVQGTETRFGVNVGP